jgi:archaellum component FlaG (FlaF/FlaG flagellin family)
VKIDGECKPGQFGKMVIRNNNEKARENVVVLAASGGVTQLLFKGAIGCINIYLV